MLAAEHRLRRSSDIGETVRRGSRASRGCLTVHLLVPGPAVDQHLTADRRPAEVVPARVTKAGLVVGKAVGGSVVRHRTARRLRHLLRPRLAGLPAGALLVVRAAPAAGGATSARLAVDLDAALASVVSRAGRRR